jgi:hypothetical protein
MVRCDGADGIVQSRLVGDGRCGRSSRGACADADNAVDSNSGARVAIGTVRGRVTFPVADCLAPFVPVRLPVHPRPVLYCLLRPLLLLCAGHEARDAVLRLAQVVGEPSDMELQSGDARVERVGYLCAHARRRTVADAGAEDARAHVLRRPRACRPRRILLTLRKLFWCWNLKRVDGGNAIRARREPDETGNVRGLGASTALRVRRTQGRF